MDLLSYSDFDEQFGFVDDVEEYVNDYTKPQFLALDDDEFYSLSLALSLAEDDILCSLRKIKDDVLTRSELLRVLGVVCNLLDIIDSINDEV